MEPKPTGYLSLYEYNWTAINFTIQVEDTLNISWNGNLQQPRFSLAYYNNRTSSAIPMLSIVVGNCDPETNLLSLNTLYCEEVTVTATDSVNMIRNVTGIPATRASTVTMTEESTFTTQASIKQSNSTTSDKTIIISGAVVFSLILLIILLIFLVVFTFAV